jgi:hypothetical protein
MYTYTIVEAGGFGFRVISMPNVITFYRKVSANERRVNLEP